jgi:hypothetical protein
VGDLLRRVQDGRLRVSLGGFNLFGQAEQAGGDRREDEQFWPGQSKQLAGMLGDLAHIVPFTAAEGANQHCQPMGRLLTDERMFSWLRAQLEG